MRINLRHLAVSILTVAVVPFLAELYLPFGHSNPGFAYAKGGGGGGGGGGEGGGGRSGDNGGRGADSAGHGSDHGGRAGGRGPDGSGSSMAGRDRDGRRGVEQANDHPGQGVGNAVSEAATSTAHAGKAAAQEAGFRNLGKAVSSAVHQAQQNLDRERETEARTRTRTRDRHREVETRIRERDPNAEVK